MNIFLQNDYDKKDDIVYKMFDPERISVSNIAWLRDEPENRIYIRIKMRVMEFEVSITKKEAQTLIADIKSELECLESFEKRTHKRTKRAKQ